MSIVAHKQLAVPAIALSLFPSHHHTLPSSSIMPPLEPSRKAMNVPYLPLVCGKPLVHHDEPSKSFSPWSATTSHHYLPFGWPPRTPPVKQGNSINIDRRIVDFSRHVGVRHVLHLRDYTTDETKNTWYNKTDLKEMKERCKTEAAQVTASDYEQELVSVYDQQEGALSDIVNNYSYQGMESTVRGLENKTEIGSIRKKRIRAQAWKAVFAEQRWQSKYGHTDPETLADIYFEVSEPCHVVANMVGLRDAREIQSLDQKRTWGEPLEGLLSSDKENQRVNFPSSNRSGILSEGASRRYERLRVLQQKAQNRRKILTTVA